MAFSTIDKSSSFMNTVLYSGNTSTQAITGVGFQPDWCWFKGRNFADNHVSIDAVRGNDKAVYPDTNIVGTTQSHYFSSFDSDGYTLGNSGIMNLTGRTYASWNWKANGSGSANTDGSISSTVSVNATSKFSIVSYVGNNTAGATVGHGLGTTPTMYIIKNREAVEPWLVYHQSLGNTQGTYLNTSGATTTNTVFTNNTSPTSSVFSVGAWGGNNGSSQDMIAYCFADVAGYSKMGGYTGNNNADGTFVYTGFKPAFVIIKANNFTGDWTMADNKRLGYNERNDQILANTNSAEVNTVAQSIDILSNGFKCRGTGTNTNGAYTYIYMAFGQPIISNSGVCATAR